MTLTSTQYPKFRSRPSTQPPGHVEDILCLFIKYNGGISFLALKTIQIDIICMFLCLLFHYFIICYGEIDNILETWRPFWI